MTTAGPPGAPSTHERVVAAAVRLTVDLGWARVTMARLAAEVGVSRQTVYNEIGTKPQLADEVLARELSRFLALVGAAFDEHPDDLRAALRSAALAVLRAADVDPLLHAVVSATQGADTELLRLLTAPSTPLLGTATALVLERAERYPTRLATDRLATAVATVVRLVLSHVVQPSDPPEQTADDIAWVIHHIIEIE